MLNRLPRLRIDFSGRIERERRQANVWLVFAMIIALAPVTLLLKFHEQTKALNVQRAALQENHSAPAEGTEDTRQQSSGAAAVDLLHAQLARPWDSLMRALEEATVGSVTLMSFQPNAVKGEVVLTGEASRYDEVLKYIDNLRTQPPFTQVFLKTHEIAEDVPGKPVRFTITLLWKNS